ncbi:hypothetical protein PUR61_33325, partial [Streptomyces sp. BE20]|uniref:hypothetical protein n=1 Tax=Streptomyces sp. BE20 TaxID=3002525 RepID=UPI002E799093
DVLEPLDPTQNRQTSPLPLAPLSPACRPAHGGLADFLTCGELLRTGGLDGAGVVPWRTHAADAWLRLGNRARAWRHVHEQLSRSHAALPNTRGPALRLLAA